MKLGYARVSTREPNREANALAAAGCEQVFVDTGLEKVGRQLQPQLREALKCLRTADTLVITRLNRAGQLLGWMSERLEMVKADLVVLDEGIDTSKDTGRQFFAIVEAMSEAEYDRIGGIAAARLMASLGLAITREDVDTRRELLEEALFWSTHLPGILAFRAIDQCIWDMSNPDKRRRSESSGDFWADIGDPTKTWASTIAWIDDPAEPTVERLWSLVDEVQAVIDVPTRFGFDDDGNPREMSDGEEPS